MERKPGLRRREGVHSLHRVSAFSSNDCTSLYLFLLFREFGFAAEDFLRRGFGLRPPFGKNLFRSLSATPLFRALEEAYPPCTPRKTQQQTIQVGNDGAFRHTTHSDVDASSRWFFDFWLFFPLFKKLGDKRFTCQQEPGPHLGSSSRVSHRTKGHPSHTCTTSSALITFPFPPHKPF